MKAVSDYQDLVEKLKSEDLESLKDEKDELLQALIDVQKANANQVFKIKRLNLRLDDEKILKLENGQMIKTLEWKSQIVEILNRKIQKILHDLEKSQFDLKATKIENETLKRENGDLKDQNADLKEKTGKLFFEDHQLIETKDVKVSDLELNLGYFQKNANYPSSTQFWQKLEENEGLRKQDLKLPKDLKSKNEYTNAMIKNQIQNLQNLIDSRKSTDGSKQEKSTLSKEQKKAKLAKNVKNLFKAAYKGRINEVRKLIENGINVNAQFSKCGTALHAAALHGYFDIVQLLLQYEIEVNAKNKFGITALDIADEENHLDIIDILLKHGAKRSY